MSIGHLVIREIRYRKLNFMLGVLSVCIAVACLVGELVILHKHDLRTEQIIAEKEEETRARMAELEDDYRKIMRNLGFNVLILPRDQNLHDLYAHDYASKFMPEEYVHRLANSRIVTIQHLLPTIQQKIEWPEIKRTVILVGTRGQVPIVHADPRKPLMEPVMPGEMVLGYELHRSLKLAVGDKVRLMGREFTVSETYGQRGNKDDITIWINLGQAQEMLDKHGLINGILALECVCAPDSLAQIRAEIQGILPETQVIEFATQVLARAEARNRAAQEARAALEREQANRDRLRAEREGFAAMLVPVAMLGAALWIGFLSFGNVRERRPEIALLRALGLGSSQILGAFLGRAILMGVAGACLGYLAGNFVGLFWQEDAVAVAGFDVLFNTRTLLLVLVAAPLLAALASWLPSMMAAQQDPAEILREE
jgi:putative ABC transport system permease protein